MGIDPGALRAELTGDPLALGYAPLIAAGDARGLAALLNAPTGPGAAPVDQSVVPAYTLFECIVPAEWSALTAANQQRIQTILAMGQVDIQGANTRGAFLAAFAAGTTTRANLQAVQTRTGSRAEALFGAAASVSAEQVADALYRQ